MKFFSSNDSSDSKKTLKIELPNWFDDEGIAYKETSTGEIIIESCPSCNRTHKLYVEPETGVAQCKFAGCDFNAGISPIDLVSSLLGITKGKAFFICYGSPEKKNQSKEDILDDDWLGEFHKERKERKKQEANLTEISFPPLIEKLTPQHEEAWNYLIKRGLSPDDIDLIGMMIIPFFDYKDYTLALQRESFSPDDIKKYTKYINRVIFPVKVDGKLYGYVARDFTNKVPKKYKVMNSEGSFRADVFWNFDNVKESDSIVICEGFIDVVKSGIDRSIAILGADMSQGQFDLLRKLKTKKIIIGLDAGTEKKQDAIFDELFLDFPGAIFKIDFPELLTQKENLLNENIRKMIGEIYPQELNLFNEKEMILPYGAYDKIKKRLQNEPNWFLSGNNALSKEDFDNFNLFFESAEYKDAGDYTKEEMNLFIKNAVPYKKDKTI